MVKVIVAPSEAKQGGFEVEQITVNDMELVETLVEKLRAGVVHFVFKKVNGEIRHAIGTIKPELISSVLPENFAKLKQVANDELKVITALIESEDNNFDMELLEGARNHLEEQLEKFEPKQGSGRAKNPEIQSYFDFEKGSFRSFKINSLIAVFI